MSSMTIGLISAGCIFGGAVLGYASSGLPGPKGNLESFVWVAEEGRGGVEDLAVAVGAVEPSGAIDGAEP